MSCLHPVLLIAFNRPLETARVIERLRLVKPLKIYFAVDGPREKHIGDAELIKLTQNLVKQFDWDCEVHTFFQKENLGCGLGVSTAISWALNNEETIIVLEDDILPDTSFFPFCEELLERYKDDNRVFAISGFNNVPDEFLVPTDSYRFTSNIHVWGWAIWKQSWEKYDFDLSEWRNELSFSQLRRQLGGSWLATILWRELFDAVANGKIDTWDYQLFFASFKSKSLVATSNNNLIENLGFGPSATHTKEIPKYLRPSSNIEFPLIHPKLKLDHSANNWSQKYSSGSLVAVSRIVLGRYIRILIGTRKLG